MCGKHTGDAHGTNTLDRCTTHGLSLGSCVWCGAAQLVGAVRDGSNYQIHTGLARTRLQGSGNGEEKHSRKTRVVYIILFHANDCINSTWWMPERVFESRSLNCSLFGRVAYGGEYYGRAAGSLAPGAEVSGSEPAELAPQSSIRIRILHTIFVQRDREFKGRTQGPSVVLVNFY